jgi:replicative DNA helicase
MKPMEFVHIREVITDCLASIERVRRSDRLINGLPTGFINIDMLTTGFHPGELVVVAGRPGAGKTGFMLSVAGFLAFWEDVPVAIFSLETTKHQLLLRMLSILSGVPLRNLRMGFVSEEVWSDIVLVGTELAESPIHIDDSPRLSTVELREKSKRLREEKGVEVIFVDYLQLLRGPFVRNTRQEEVADISIELKALAKELGIPVVALAQLSRQAERRQNKRPQLVDLRDSGQIEEVADIVLFIHRPSTYKLSSQREEVAEIIVAKQRQGATGIVKLVFDKETTEFKPLLPSNPKRVERYNPEEEAEDASEDFDLDF